MPYLEGVAGWERIPEKRHFIEESNLFRTRGGGPPLTEQEESIWIAQARMIGDLQPPAAPTSQSTVVDNAPSPSGAHHGRRSMSRQSACTWTVRA